MDDLGRVLEMAASAARRGDTRSLEVQLKDLRRLPVHGCSSVATALRAMAASVREHPARGISRAAQAS